MRGIIIAAPIAAALWALILWEAVQMGVLQTILMAILLALLGGWNLADFIIRER